MCVCICIFICICVYISQTSLYNKSDFIEGGSPHLWFSFQDNKYAGVQHVAQHPAALPEAGEHHPDPSVSRQGANRHCALPMLKLSAGQSQSQTFPCKCVTAGLTATVSRSPGGPVSRRPRHAGQRCDVPGPSQEQGGERQRQRPDGSGDAEQRGQFHDRHPGRRANCERHQPVRETSAGITGTLSSWLFWNK